MKVTLDQRQAGRVAAVALGLGGLLALRAAFGVKPGVIVSGIVFGSLAGINSLGVVMLWRTTRLVNLAQPSMGLVGGVLTGLLYVSADWPFWLAVPVGLGMGALLGLAADRIILRRLREAPRAVLLVATVALAQVYGAIQTALPFAFGGTLPTYSLDLGFTIRIRPTVLLGPDILTLIAFPLTLLGSLWFLYRSRFGIAALALGQDAERAQSLGIPAAVVRSAVWAVAGLLATVSGILAIPVLGYGLGGRLSPTVLLLALAPAVLAGLRSLTGAAVWALVIGVAYKAAESITGDGLVSQLIVAGLVIAAVAVQGRRLGRGEAVSRASSWEAAATPRPLPRHVAWSEGYVTVLIVLGIVAVLAPLFPPWLLSAGQISLYASTSAFALGALAVSVAWMFAGEIALGHWGFAGLAAALTVYLPGPWPLRVVVSTIVLGVGMAGLGWASRRRAGLGFAVIGLAAAAASYVTGIIAGDRAIGADPATTGPIVASLTIAAAIGVALLRSSRLGARLVAARDDPDRAAWFAIDPVKMRMIALGISGALAGLAGSLYASGTKVGLSGGFFDPSASLLLLSLAVIGGLGSPAGTLLAVGLYQASSYLLPAWGNLLTSGIGVLLVVIFMPGGLGRLVTGVRDLVARPFVRVPGRPVETAEQMEAART
jgi:branched-subunit amino acid ABC-type transport system permease component